MSRSWKRWRRQAYGVTLVEAVAGAALLGMLLVSILVVKGRLAVRYRLAEDRVRGCEILDTLLERWWRERDTLPRNSAGVVPGSQGWRWRTRTVESDEAESLQAEIVAIELFSPARNDAMPTGSLEILLPRKNHEAEDRPDID